MKRLLIVLVALSVMFACTSPQPKQKNGTNGNGQLKPVKVAEVVQAASYTYLRVTDALIETWVAVAKQEYVVGEELFMNFASAVTMENFHSKELNRDFPSILFVSQVSKEQEVASEQQPVMGGSALTPMGKKAAPVQANVTVEPAKGGVTVAELYANKTKYSGMKVKIRGSVVKVNNGILGRNWVHVQDGTNNDGDFDLTITTTETVLVNDITTFEGVLALEKDFTAGYFYPLIVEDAVLVK